MGARLGEGQSGRKGPTPFLPNRGGQLVSREQVLARIRAPGSLYPPCFGICVCCFPSPEQPTMSWRQIGALSSQGVDCFWPPERSTLALASVRSV